MTKQQRQTVADRPGINHGHNSWNERTGRWDPTYLTWCPSCRAAKAVK